METLQRLYRFAFLLKGSSSEAASALSEVLARFGSQIDQLRSSKQRSAFLVRKLREQPFTPKPEPSDALGEESKELRELGERFSALAEPTRSALALFYCELFTPTEAADLLKMSLEQYAEALALGRTMLSATDRIAS